MHAMKSFSKMLCLAAGLVAGLGTTAAHAEETAQGTPTDTTGGGGATAVTTPSATTVPVVTTDPSAGDSMTIYRKIHPNRPILITGAALLVGSYVPTVAIQAAEGRPEDKDLYIPVVGPWITLANRDCNGTCENETRDTALMVTSGILQGAGAALTIASFFIPEKVEAAKIQAGPATVQVLPSRVGSAGYGVGAVGTF
jgi:hypothetical protein